MATDTTMDVVMALGNVVKQHQKTFDALREQFEAQVRLNQAAQNVNIVNAAKILLLQAAVAVLASEASTRAVERLEALLTTPLDTIQDIDPASPLGKSVQEAADRLKYDLYRLQE